ncbi:TetR/AcrR family transcriptional regulator [Mycobacterium sp. E740]|uniref:TetR/AcrR family transcriptional regulator n=1 Tax=Mycobacterium sp. E740 TaxID=1834149 RepID=UPI0007FD26A0|nr:TetR/AcrR family transcriptional regulator [Mycobacterium sp. E740]OBI76922.1 TetR family transcriptional regulator [Mycobacterium sp. E740]
MSRTRPAGGDGVRRRPKDRKAQIARASAEAFSTLGFHGVSMESIASRVGISAAALYRHYASKYDLFRDAVLSLGQQLVDATAFAGESDDPQLELNRLVAALTDTAMANRESGGLYRWEGRYLRGDDQASLIAQMRTVHHRIQRPLSTLRPELSSPQRWTLSIAVLSVIGSIVDHRAKLPAVQVRALLADLSAAVLTSELPDIDPDQAAERPVASVPTSAEPSKYEALLNESMRLFNINGYRDTGMEDIAAAVGMPASGIYRYFAGKSDILAAAFRRAADRLSDELTAITGSIADPEDALSAVIDAYVARSFAQPELDYVYYTERLNMSPTDQKILRNMQRGTVESWVSLVVAMRPEWTPGQARFAVHAAMSLVIDLGRLMRYANTPQNRLVLQRLLDVTLLGRYRLRATLPAK